MTADKIRAHIDEIRDEFAQERSLILPALKFAQTEKGYLTPEDLAAVAEATNLSQAFVESVDAFQRDTWETEAMRRQLRTVPAGRIAESWEQAELVTFLASGSSDFIAGQVIPFAGGWVTSS